MRGDGLQCRDAEKWCEMDCGVAEKCCGMGWVALVARVGLG